MWQSNGQARNVRLIVIDRNLPACRDPDLTDPVTPMARDSRKNDGRSVSGLSVEAPVAIEGFSQLQSTF